MKWMIVPVLFAALSAPAAAVPTPARDAVRTVTVIMDPATGNNFSSSGACEGSYRSGTLLRTMCKIRIDGPQGTAVLVRGGKTLCTVQIGAVSHAGAADEFFAHATRGCKTGYSNQPLMGTNIMVGLRLAY